MAIIFEPNQHARERELRDRERYPELAFSDPDELLRIDRANLRDGFPLTSFGQLAVETFARIGIPEDERLAIEAQTRREILAASSQPILPELPPSPPPSPRTPPTEPGRATAATTSLSPEAEEQLFAQALAEEERASASGPSALGQLRQQAAPPTGLPPPPPLPGPAPTPTPGPTPPTRPRRLLSPEEERRLFEEALAVDERSAPAGPPSIIRDVQRDLRLQAVDEALFEPALLEQDAAFAGGDSVYAEFKADRRRRAVDESLMEAALLSEARGGSGRSLIPWGFDWTVVSPYQTMPTAVLVPRIDGLLDPDRADESLLEVGKRAIGDLVDAAAGELGGLLEAGLGASGAWLNDRLVQWGESVEDVADQAAGFVEFLGQPGFADDIDAFGDRFEQRATTFGSHVEQGLAQGGDWANAAVAYGLGGTLEFLINHPNPREIVARNVADVDQMWLHQQKFPGVEANGHWRNQMLGLTIAEFSTCNERTVLDGGIVLYENCGAGVADEFFEHADVRALTMGNFIFVRDSFDLTNANDVEVLFEEIAHVHQYAIYGDSFLPEYLDELDRNGYALNQFELDAKAAAKEMLHWWQQRQAAAAAPLAPASPPPAPPRPEPAPTPTPVPSR